MLISSAVGMRGEMPTVAMDAAGNFVVAWASVDFTGYYDVYARLFSADGAPVTTQFRVNTTIGNTQDMPTVAMTAAGDFVIAWRSALQDSGTFDRIVTRRYSASGAALSGEVVVNSSGGFPQWPSVGVNALGDFIVAWERSGEIYSRRYVVGSGWQGNDTLVDESVTGGKGRPWTAIAPDGRAVISWHASGADGFDSGVRARRYASDGSSVGSAFLVNTYTSGYQLISRVAIDALGSFVVTWQSAGQDGSSEGVYAQRYAADGSAQGAEFRLNSTILNSQILAAVALDADGDLIGSWQSNGQDGSSWGIYAQRFAGFEDVDLALTKTDSLDPVAVNGTVIYTLDVSNTHAAVAPTGVAVIDTAIGSASGIRVIDTLPNGTSLVSSAGADWLCSTAGQTVSCGYQQTLLADTSTSVELNVQMPSSAGDRTNSASLEAWQYDANQANNTDSEITTVCANAGALSFFNTGFLVTEGGTATIQVRRTGSTCYPVTVTYTTSSGTAQSGTDFEATSGTLSWANGDSSIKTFTVQTTQDNLDEFNESVNLTLSNPTGGATIGSPGTAILTIVDDDDPPKVSISTADSSVTEGGTQVVSVQLSAPSSTTVTVPFNVGGGSASNGSDYTATSSPITIPAGSTTATLVTISTIDDVRDEEVETVTVNLGVPTGASLGSDTSFTLSIEDNDAPPTVSISSPDASVTEGGSKLVSVQLSTASAKTVSVSFSVSGTATAGVDYSTAPGPVTLAPGVTSATLTTINTVDDALDEDAETVVVTLSGPDNATLGSDTSFALTIDDNDAAPTVSFTTYSQIVGEAVGSTTVTAQLSAISERQVTVPIAISPASTAQHPQDFTLSASQIVIPPGSLSGTLTVYIVDDSNIEPLAPNLLFYEEAILNMVSPINAAYGAIQHHSIGIKDNDPITLPIP